MNAPCPYVPCSFVRSSGLATGRRGLLSKPFTLLCLVVTSICCTQGARILSQERLSAIQSLMGESLAEVGEVGNFRVQQIQTESQSLIFLPSSVPSHGFASSSELRLPMTLNSLGVADHCLRNIWESGRRQARPHQLWKPNNSEKQRNFNKLSPEEMV